LINETLGTFIISFYKLINWFLTFTQIMCNSSINNWISMLGYFLYVIFLRLQSGLSILITNCAFRWYPNYLHLMLLRQVAHTRGAPLMMELGSLEMTTSSVCILLSVAPLQYTAKPTGFTIRLIIHMEINNYYNIIQDNDHCGLSS